MTPKNKWKIILPLIIIAALAVAFYVGGNAPGSHGWNVGDDVANDTVISDAAVADDNNGEADDPQPTDEPGTETDNTQQTATPDEPDNNVSANDEPIDEPQPTDDPADEIVDEPVMVINPETGKDRYQTDPVPEGKPVPVEPQDVTIGSTAYSCTISINCSTILDNIAYCDPEKVELVPEDGWILKPLTVTFYEGESVFNVLQRVCKQQKIHMEYEDTPIYNSAYIEGIHNLYEFDVGELSGWMYKVNDWFPNYGSSRYQLQDGDVICWEYTCDLGNDIGGGYSAGNMAA
ncbi:MAG: DUF4430 domain-containing protein [Firmicutes bacterium]|nr:DUF4430 domain-containing protein [Bacillota bacterium]